MPAPGDAHQRVEDPILRPLKPASMGKQAAEAWVQCGHYRDSIRLLKDRLASGQLDAASAARARRNVEHLRIQILKLEAEL